MKYLVMLLFLTGCSHWAPVKRCLDTYERDSTVRSEMSLCKTLWWWE